jgi:hypothetical protein
MGPYEYVQEAMIRAKRRKSPWNIVLAIVAVVAIGLVYCLVVAAVIYLPHPPDTTFRQISNGHDIQMILITLPLFFPSIAWGMVLANLLMWLIPPARATLDREAEGYKGCAFRELMSGLMKFAVIATVIAVPIALIASYRIRL